MAERPRPRRSGEGDLLTRLSAGDRQAAEELVDQTYRQVYAALVRFTGGDADLAADLTQETYRKAWKSLPRFQRRAQLATWLYRIAYNTFLNHVRRPQRLLPLEEGAEASLPAPGPQPDQILGRGAAAERVRRAVLGLPEDLRFTVAARYWGDLPVRRIAEMEEVTPVAIRKRLKRAFAAMAAALEEER